MVKFTMKARKELTAAHNEWNLRWCERGGKLTKYLCTHCCSSIFTAQPQKKDVTDKGYWDSAHTCHHCGKLSFVLVYPSGRTIARKMGD